jgi:O-antigen ligase
MGLYVSFSRGALFACVAGLVALLVLAPRRVALEGLLTALGAGVLAAVAAAPFHSFTSLAGSRSSMETDGGIVLALLVLIMAAAALLTALKPGRIDEPLRLPPRAGWIAVGVICAGLALAIVVGAKEHSARPLAAGASRLTTLQSNRYAYWRVAMRAFAHEPLRGVGAGGWAVWWLRYRPFSESAQDAHSLPLQTLAELGIVGLALLAAFLAGVGLAARDAFRAHPALAAGPVAAFVVWLAHQPLDWDWQMPALTLFAIVLAGSLLALTALPRSAAPRG